MTKGFEHPRKPKITYLKQLALGTPSFIVLIFFLTACLSEPPTDFSPLEVSAAAVTMTSPCFDSGCHSELIEMEEEYKHRPYVDQKCLECHQIYHDEEIQHDYLEHDILLCLQCHPGSALGNTHPVGEGVIDPNTGQMMTCTSTCHLNHTAPYPYLLALSGSGELCFSCHEDFLN
jgi:predicted CXXCH cytochrome family protein